MVDAFAEAGRPGRRRSRPAEDGLAQMAVLDAILAAARRSESNGDRPGDPVLKAEGPGDLPDRDGRRGSAISDFTVETCHTDRRVGCSAGRGRGRPGRPAAACGWVGLPIAELIRLRGELDGSGTLSLAELARDELAGGLGLLLRDLAVVVEVEDREDDVGGLDDRLVELGLADLAVVVGVGLLEGGLGDLRGRRRRWRR